MNRLRGTVVAVTGLAAVAVVSAQTPPPAQPPSNPTVSVTHPTTNPELDGASTAPRQSPQVRMALAGNVTPGMLVKSPSGDVLGKVASIVPGEDQDRVKGYVVVASAGGMATPVPYETASTMVRHDSLVVEKSRLENAPKVQQYQKEDGSGKAWQKQADNYWQQREAHLD